LLIGLRFNPTELCITKYLHTMWPIIAFLIVLLHLLLGFGFMYYKLSPKKKTETIVSSNEITGFTKQLKKENT